MMSTTISTGWLKDNNGDKFAPKTLSSQVVTSEGITLEEKIQQKLDEIDNGGIDPNYEFSVENITDLADNYYNKVEIDEALVFKADKDHDHDEAYVKIDTVYDKVEMDSALDSKADKEHFHEGVYEPINTASSVVETHNVNTEAHGDIRKLISDLATQVNNFLDVDEDTRDQLSEVLEMIDGNSGSLDELTKNKVNVSDIIDNLETATANQVLSANQGVAIKQLIDALKTGLTNGTFEVGLSTKLSSSAGGVTQPIYFEDGKPVATTYALDKAGVSFGLVKSGGDVTIKDGVITVNDDSHNHITTDIDGLDTTLSGINTNVSNHKNDKNNPHNVTLGQLGVTATAGELNILDGVTATTAELNKLDGLTATTTELNYVDGVTSNIQTQLDGKAASSHGTHVSYSATAPLMDGTASVGSASTVARSDHKHPTDTSRASKTEFDTHTKDTTVHITSAERTNWNNKSSTDTKYTTGTGELTSTKLYLVGAQTKGSVEGVRTYTNGDVYIGTDNCLRSNGTKVSVEGHSHDTATTSVAGFMSASDKTKLNNLSSSTYAGGTAVTLNGTGKGASTASFYAPTTAGTSGQFLKSNGSGSAPTWVDAPKSVTVDTTITDGSNNAVSSNAVYDALAGKVPTTRTINGKALSSNITLSASDVGIEIATGNASIAVPAGDRKGVECMFGKTFSSVPCVTLALVMPDTVNTAVLGLCITETSRESVTVYATNNSQNDRNITFNWIAITR